MPTAESPLILYCVVAYLAVCAVVGAWSMRRTKSTVDFFLAGKSLGPVVVVMATISSMMSGFGFVGGPGLVYESGSSSLWISFVVAFALPLAYVMLGKRLRLLVEIRDVLTLPETVRARYGGRWPMLAMSVAIILGVLGYLGTQILAVGVVLQAVLGVNLYIALAIGLSVLAFYSIAGGILAGVYTDLFQGILMIGASVMVLAYCMDLGGGMSEISRTLWDMDPDFIGPWGARGEIGSLTWILLFGIGVCGQPHIVTKLMMIKDIRQMKWGAVASGASFLLMALLWLGVGFTMRTLVERGDHAPLASPDLAAPTFLMEYTPPLLAGLVFAAMLAATMSTADSFLNVGAAAMVRDIPKAVMGRAPDQELLWSRLATGLLLVLSTVFALYMENLIALLGTFAYGTFAAALLPSVAIGMNWKRATGAACVASIATGIAVNFTLELSARHGSPLLSPEIAVGAVAVMAATAVFIAVSLLTPRRELPSDIDALLDV